MSAAAGNFDAWLHDRVDHVSAVLDDLLPPVEDDPARLHEAMRYAVLGPGKRVRAALVSTRKLRGNDRRGS